MRAVSYRHYQRTGPDTGYSVGPFLAVLLSRPLWLLIDILLLAGSFVGAIEGNVGSAVLFAAIVFGGWLGLRRH